MECHEAGMGEALNDARKEHTRIRYNARDGYELRFEPKRLQRSSSVGALPHRGLERPQRTRR